MQISALEFWKKSFPNLEQWKNRGLVLPEEMDDFWHTYYPPFSILAQITTNSDVYWRKIQNLFAKITGSANAPCPFTQQPQFIEFFHSTVMKLKTDSINQLIIFLDFLPASTRSIYSVLWEVSSLTNYSHILIELLYTLQKTSHKIWEKISDYQSTEMIFDKFFPFLEPSTETSFIFIESHIMIIELLKAIVEDLPWSQDPEKFQNYVELFLYRMYKFLNAGNITLEYHAFYACCSILFTYRNVISSQFYSVYLQDFIKSILQNNFFEPYAIHFLSKLNYPDSIDYLSSIFLDEDFPASSSYQSFQRTLTPIDLELLPLIPTHANIIKKLMVLSVNNHVLSRLALKFLPLEFSKMPNNFRSQWIISYIKLVTDFITKSYSRNKFCRKCCMSFDLLITLSRTQIPWLNTELSLSSGILSQISVPTKLLNQLPPPCRIGLTPPKQDFSHDMLKNMLNKIIADEVPQKVKPPKNDSQKAPKRNNIPLPTKLLNCNRINKINHLKPDPNDFQRSSFSALPNLKNPKIKLTRTSSYSTHPPFIAKPKKILSRSDRYL